MGNRLLLVERIDAYSLLVWAGALTGDFDLAERNWTSASRSSSPAKCRIGSIHLLAWRAVALHLEANGTRRLPP